MKSKKQKHLTLSERILIEQGITNNSTKVAISKVLGKSNSTIGKEIKKHRRFKQRNVANNRIDCIFLKECKKQCLDKCERYKKIPCYRRDVSPGSCNGCAKKTCRLDKYHYDATKAHAAYKETLVDSRCGVDLTTHELITLAGIIKPLIQQGHSINHILMNHPEIKLSSKTLYNYFDQGVFQEFSIHSMDLRRKAAMKLSTTKKRKKREHYQYVEGRRFHDFLSYIEKYPDTRHVEMDTLYNSKQGPFIQTFLFKGSNLMIGILHQKKTQESMIKGIRTLHTYLGDTLFKYLFPIILTGRGPEFTNAVQMEQDKDGNKITQIFYCDPQQSSQKARVENNHKYVRYILENEMDLTFLTQNKVDLSFHHINSSPRLSLNKMTPYEMFKFQHGEEVIKRLKIKKIDKDEVILKPSLFKIK